MGNFFHRRKPPMETELQFHVDRLIQENLAAGMTPAEARRRATLEFGGADQIKEELHDVYRMAVVDATLRNLKSAVRFIRKSPTFSLTVILTLALGIGANSAVFSAIHTILLQPLPFPEGDQLMTISQYNTKARSTSFVAPVRVEDWNRMNSTFQAITGYYVESDSETSSSLPERLTQAFVAPRFLQVWGVAPALGRDFSTDELRLGGPSAALISDRLWHQRFDADPSAIGKKLRFEKSYATIVGVMPTSFLFPDPSVDAWLPVPVNGSYAQLREDTWYTVIGRLKQGSTAAQARADLETVQSNLGRQYPKTDANLEVTVQPLKETIVSGARKSLWILFGSVSLLLLIACTNIVALLLARATQRRHEIAVRFALGASRSAVVTQLLTEVFVLALAGAALGLFVAEAASGIFRALAADLPRVGEIRLDFWIVLYSLGCSVVVTLLCGLLPALRETRVNLSSSLAQTGRTQVSGRNRLQWLMVGIQVALAVTLLDGAGLLLRSFQALGRVSPGFEMSHVLTFHISASWGESSDYKAVNQRIWRTLDRLRTLPGVEGVATSDDIPGIPQQQQMAWKIPDGVVDPQRKIMADARFVSPSYFSTMHIPLLGGKSCREGAGTPTEIMVNRSFANEYLSGSTPEGHHIQAPDNAFLPTGEIRGVVADAREHGINHAPVPTVYWCISAPVPDPTFLLRTHGDPMAMANTVRQTVHDIDPGRSVYDISSLEQQLSAAFGQDRMRTVLLGFFAATAILLACMGIYGTLSYTVSVRQREVGLRLALGALRSQITKLFLVQGLAVSLAGCAAGWVLAVLFARVLLGMLYGVAPSDVLTLAGVIFLVLFVAVAASLAPAIRAARVEPMSVLRDE